MLLNKRQKAILEFAENHRQFQSSDVMTALGNEIKVEKITIIRDLSALVSLGLLVKSGKGRSVRYQLSEQSQLLKEIDAEEYFAQPYLERDAKESFNFEIFENLKNNLFSSAEEEKIMSLQKEFQENFSRYQSQTLIKKEFERIMIEFSWKSSAIEGNTYSLLNTEALIKENIAAAGKTKEETTMILNHKDSFNAVMKNQQNFLQLHYSDLENLQKTLTKNLAIAQNIRKMPVGITGTKYKPLDNAFQIKEALENMIDLINEKTFFFEKAFLALVLTSYIQAFEDGNKRVARMLSNAILLAHNSIPLSYRIISIEEYKKASLLFYEKNNLFHFKRIFIAQFKDAVKNYFN